MTTSTDSENVEVEGGGLAQLRILRLIDPRFDRW